MSDQIKDNISDEANSDNDSVDEAVFKYVGRENLNGVNEDREGSVRNDKKSLSLKEEKKYVTSHNDDESNAKKEQDNNQSTNNNHETGHDMTWFLKNDEDMANTSFGHNDTSGDRHQSNRDHDSLNNDAIALAAVVAAYETEKLNKSKRKNEDVVDDFMTGGNGTSSHVSHNVDDQLIHERSFKKQKSNQTTTSEEDEMVNKLQASLKKNKAQLAVDPELATLDDPSSQNQLVNKAIAEANSISQQADFQQYLNTEAEAEVNHAIATGLDKVNEHENDNRSLHEVVEEPESPKVTGDNRSAVTAAAAVAVAVSLQNADRDHAHHINRERDTIRKMQESIDADNELLESAASKASEIIGSAASTQTSGKAFDPTEEAALDHFIEEYQRIKKFTRRETCERIWTNGRRKDDFWINICKVLPYRTRSSIYKHVRRRYHIFDQRGRWTPEEDRQLAELCVEKEGQWSEVGKAMGRMPEDCRDRWRNYIKCGNNRASNKWSPQEEAMLKQVIAGMLQEAEAYQDRKEQGLLSADQDNITQTRGPRGKKISGKPTFKDIINWTVVSERMGGTRSRIQCRYKWNKLIRKQAVSKAEQIPNPEKRWLVEKLRDLGFTEDSQVDWDELATLQGNKWSGLELKVCYEKMRTMVKSYKGLSISEVSKALMDILLDENMMMDKE
ncbi:RNA polymerase I termination factor [Monosporozyma unispora]|nr:RNA polymerase I enhancer binding protein [Kazachstania unispora]